MNYVLKCKFESKLNNQKCNFFPYYLIGSIENYIC